MTTPPCRMACGTYGWPVTGPGTGTPIGAGVAPSTDFGVGVTAGAAPCGACAYATTAADSRAASTVAYDTTRR